MTFRTGKESHTIVTAGAITKYAVDLKPICTALVLPEKIHLLKLDTEVYTLSSFFYMEYVSFFIMKLLHVLFKQL